MSLEGDVRVTLCSNGSLELFPDNTLTKFSNRLKSPLKFPAEEKWRVALSFLACQNKYIGDPSAGEVLTVNADVALSYYQNPRALSVHALTKRPYKYHVHQPRHPVFVDLAAEDVRTIGVELRGRGGRTLFLQAGQPTIVTLLFRKMESNATSRVIRVDSNEDSSGKAHDFAVSLPPELSLPGDSNAEYRCALTKVTWKAKFPTLSEMSADWKLGLKRSKTPD